MAHTLSSGASISTLTTYSATPEKAGEGRLCILRAVGVLMLGDEVGRVYCAPSL